MKLRVKCFFKRCTHLFSYQSCILSNSYWIETLYNKRRLTTKLAGFFILQTHHTVYIFLLFFIVYFRKNVNLGLNEQSCWSTISKTRASVSSGYPNTEKQMKARGRRPSAFIVSRSLDTPMKHEARVLEITSPDHS